MSHQHFCDVAGHWWECNGEAIRDGHTEPSVCICGGCHLPLKDAEHSRCRSRVEVVVCPEHREEACRQMEEAKKKYDRQAGEFGFDSKWSSMKSLPDGPEKHALAEEIVAWLFR